MTQKGWYIVKQNSQPTSLSFTRENKKLWYFFKKKKKKKKKTNKSCFQLFWNTVSHDLIPLLFFMFVNDLPMI